MLISADESKPILLPTRCPNCPPRFSADLLEDPPVGEPSQPTALRRQQEVSRQP